MDARHAQPGHDSGLPDQADEPLVSVVIPAYCCTAYIVETLDSVFAQTWRNLEVIVVNDGSPDTAAFEQALQPYRDRIVYLRQENLGPSGARNAGIERSQGRYIALLDSDDCWLPEHVAYQMEHFSGDPRLALVYANTLLVRDGRVVGEGFDAVPQAGAVNLDSLLSEDCTVNTSSVVALKTAMVSAGGFDETMNYCEDFDLWLRMSAGGARMACDSRVQVRHRVNLGLSTNAEGMKRGRLRAYEKITQFAKLTPSQQAIVERKRTELEAQIPIEIARQKLEEGRFEEAQAALQQARKLAPTLKLQLATLGMQVSPRLARSFYRRYLRLLEARKRIRTTRPAHKGPPGGALER